MTQPDEPRDGECRIVLYDDEQRGISVDVFANIAKAIALPYPGAQISAGPFPGSFLLTLNRGPVPDEVDWYTPDDWDAPTGSDLRIASTGNASVAFDLSEEAKAVLAQWVHAFLAAYDEAYAPNFLTFEFTDEDGHDYEVSAARSPQQSPRTLLATARDALAAVRDLHTPTEGDQCPVCAVPDPCPTRQAATTNDTAPTPK